MLKVNEMTNIGELEQKLNQFWEKSEDEIYTFKITKKDENIHIECLDDLKNLEWELKVEYDEDMGMTTLVTVIITEMYNEFINPQSKIVAGWKGYINRKVKSLGLAMQKNDTEKVNKINKDMCCGYKKMCNAKFQASEYKIFISMLYNIKDGFEPVKEC